MVPAENIKVVQVVPMASRAAGTFVSGNFDASEFDNVILVCEHTVTGVKVRFDARTQSAATTQFASATAFSTVATNPILSAAAANAMNAIYILTPEKKKFINVVVGTSGGTTSINGCKAILTKGDYSPPTSTGFTTVLKIPTQP